MPRYLVQCSYTPDAWAAQLRNPTNRVEAVQPALEKVGAKFESVYFAFGDYDVVIILDAPDNTVASAVALAITSGGAVSSYKTTPLMTVEEGIAAMRQGAEVAAIYKPPAG